jgi:hypothetical protein
MNTSVGGMIAIAAPARIKFGLSLARPRSTFSASVSTWAQVLPVLTTTSGQKKLFQAYRADQLGRRVPDDLGVVGFDDIPEAAFFKPALTTVRHDLLELGRLAVRELHRVIQAHRSGRPAAATSLVLQPQLVLRESA